MSLIGTKRGSGCCIKKSDILMKSESRSLKLQPLEGIKKEKYGEKKLNSIGIELRKTNFLQYFLRLNLQITWQRSVSIST